MNKSIIPYSLAAFLCLASAQVAQAEHSYWLIDPDEDSLAQPYLLAQDQSKQAIDPLYIKGMKEGIFPSLEALLQALDKQAKLKAKRVTSIEIIALKDNRTAIALGLITNNAMLRVIVDAKTMAILLVE